MLQTPRATRGMVVAPHHLAAQAGLRVLRDGGNAIETKVAAASVVATPHRNRPGAESEAGVRVCFQRIQLRSSDCSAARSSRIDRNMVDISGV